MPEGKKGYFELPVFNYFEVRCSPSALFMPSARPWLLGDAEGNAY